MVNDSLRRELEAGEYRQRGQREREFAVRTHGQLDQLDTAWIESGGLG